MPEPSAPGAAARETWILCGILAVAFVLRLLHLFELQTHDPYFTLPAVDGQLYHAQAQSIANGEGLQTPVLILGPAYPYFMALLYSLFGPSLFALKGLQVAIGTIDCLLVAQLARLHFDRATGLWAAGFAAVYGMLIFYGGTVMIVNVMMPAVLASAILVTLALRQPTLLRWGAAGLMVAAATLARQTMLLFVLLVVPWIFYALRGRLPFVRRVVLAAAFGAGVLLPILPFTIRNYVVGNELVLLNSTGGIAVYMGNTGAADGTWVPPQLGLRADSPLAMQAAFTTVAERETGRKLKTTEVSSYWMARAVESVRENPGKWLVLEARKFVLFWNAREVWNNRSIDIARGFSWVLRLPLLSFGVLAPIALVGLGMSVRRWRELFPLHAVVLVYFATALAFAVLSRYRIPAVPILMIFAAHAVVTSLRWARERRWRPLALAAIAGALLAAFSNYDMGSENLYMAHYNVGNKYLHLGRHDEAIESFERSLAINAGFAPTYNNLALAYEGGGYRDEAVATWGRVLAYSIRTGDTRREERARRHLATLGTAARAGGEDGTTP
jgi:4-amino-4-deoxy-L-arabinose transferase-like glycosyltransferase